MRKTGLLVAVALCSVAIAQPGRKPPPVGGQGPFPTLGPSASTGSVFATLSPAVDEVQQIQALPDLDANGIRRSGFFQLALTVVRAGGGTPSLLLGILDTNTNPWSFTENTSALLGSQSTAGFFAPSLSPDLLIMIADNGTNVFWATRANRTVPFQLLTQTGINPMVDASLFHHEGTDYVAFVNAFNLTTIDATPINRNRYPNDPRTQAGFETIVFPPFLDSHSPAFLLDNTINARAVIHSCDMGGPGSKTKGRPWYNPILRASTANLETSRQFYTGPNDNTILEHPCSFAATTIYPTKPPAGVYGDPTKIRIVASCGDAIPAAGGTFKLSAWLPYQEANGWVVSIMIGVPANDITIPGWAGKWALDLTQPFFVLPPKLWSGNDLSKEWLVPAPAAAPGVPLWTQTLAFDPLQSFAPFSWYLGPTGPLTWF
jgi:hypothetical protein